MSKTIRNLFDKKLTINNLLKAHKRAKKGKCLKKEVLLFEVSLETNIVNLFNELKNNIYKTGKYREFTVYEPKERIIKSLPYVDRIVHQWYIYEFIKPFYKDRFISDTYACIDKRGIHKAVLKTQEYIRRNKYDYVLKCDIKKFFYSVDKKVLINILENKILDKKIMNLTEVILETDFGGLPIGNYTSQYFANIYLTDLDYFIKYDLKVEFYIRYMDDFIIISKKEECKTIYNKIEKFLHIYKLELNKKTKYFPIKFGIDFCGYVIYKDYILLRKRFKKNLYKKLKFINLLSLNSYLNHMNHCNSYNFKKKIINKMNNYKI